MLVEALKRFIWPAPTALANLPLLDGRTMKSPPKETSDEMGSTHTGPVNDKARTLSAVDLPFEALNEVSPTQQKPPDVPVLVQASVFIVRPAVQVESPTSAETSEPLNFTHWQ